ncbi:rhomboid family intramembrane serine protease [uncultured Victivallis sp.]|uniref:rhomboid family intramembrane serine protease n=1 Tax=uncultured Victivallis sp. TaxID=354118 RepID=UPI0025DD3DC4|nr:rhomboid family intramembrane serine protease [uncultured Victivallis sp.]
MALYDRGYMRGSSPGEQAISGMGMIMVLIAINVVLFLAGNILPGLAEMLLLTPQGIRSGRIYQLVTAGFLHLEFFHLFFNMWGLYLFGGLVAPHIGGRRFLWLYLIGAVSGNLLYLVLNWNSPGGLLGASGAVFAVMVATALLEPNRQFFIIPLPIPMKTRTLVVCYTILEVLLLANNKDGIAHLAHLGGVIGGYLYMKLLYGNRLAWDPFRRRPAAWRPQFRGGAPEPPPVGGAGNAAQRGGPVGARELDALLDKVSRYGINSLSEYELARLRQAREEMRGGK